MRIEEIPGREGAYGKMTLRNRIQRPDTLVELEEESEEGTDNTYEEEEYDEEEEEEDEEEEEEEEENEPDAKKQRTD